MSAPNSNQSALGFDTDTVIDAAQVVAFAGLGYVFCLRYLSLQATTQKGDLSTAEAQTIITNGLGLMPVQHVPYPGWFPDATLGASYGANAVAQATVIGVPPQVNIWMDLEGVNISAASADVIAYCENWFDAVNSAGYLPGIYVGANCGLNATQLGDLPFQHYWKSLSNVPPIPNRGYQMVQTASPAINGIDIDIDNASTDQLGGQVQWWSSAST